MITTPNIQQSLRDKIQKNRREMLYVYIMCGIISFADDGLNTLSEQRRHGGFLMVVTNPNTREIFFRVSHGVKYREAVTDLNLKHASVT